MEMTPVVGGAEFVMNHNEVSILGDALELYAASLRNLGDTFVGAGNPTMGRILMNRARYVEKMGFQVELQYKQTPA